MPVILTRPMDSLNIGNLCNYRARIRVRIKRIRRYFWFLTLIRRLLILPRLTWYFNRQFLSLLIFLTVQIEYLSNLKWQENNNKPKHYNNTNNDLPGILFFILLFLTIWSEVDNLPPVPISGCLKILDLLVLLLIHIANNNYIVFRSPIAHDRLWINKQLSC